LLYLFIVARLETNLDWGIVRQSGPFTADCSLPSRGHECQHYYRLEGDRHEG
jgi:hypothetical protein